MKRFAAAVLVLTIAISLCGCRDILYDEDKTPVPKFDMTVSYNYADETLSTGTETGEGEVYYTQSLGTASVESKADDHTAKAINDSLSTLYAQLGEEAAYTKKLAADQPSDSVIELSYRCSPEATRCDTRVLSLVFNVVQNTGGIHADLVRYSRCYDSDSGKELGLDDIAKDAEQLRTFIENYVIGLAAGEEFKENGESIFFPEFEDTIRGIVAAGEQWYLDETGLVLYADPYDIAPYGYGVICFDIPYSALSEFIDEELIPDTAHEGENGIMLAELGDDFERDSVSMVGCVTVSEGAQSIILSAEETVYNVKLYSAERMLWQRNYMTAGEAMELICYIPDAVPNILLSYQLADGTEVIRGVFQSGKDGSILLIEMSEEEMVFFSNPYEYFE